MTKGRSEAMTPLERYTALCQAAGLKVIYAGTAGKQIFVGVENLPVTVDTLAGRLGVAFAVSYGDGTTAPQLWFIGG